MPMRLLGATVVYPSSLALKLRALDPFFFQGGDPQSNTFMYFSFLDTPSNNARGENSDTYELQIILSWPYRKGWMGREEPLDVPAMGKEKVALMKRMAEGWAEPFREMVMNMPEDTDPKAIVLEDFLPKERMWDNMEGRITLVGDAAHAMTMCTYYSPYTASLRTWHGAYYTSRSGRWRQPRHHRHLIAPRQDPSCHSDLICYVTTRERNADGFTRCNQYLRTRDDTTGSPCSADEPPCLPRCTRLRKNYGPKPFGLEASHGGVGRSQHLHQAASIDH